ncbi:M48 family metalloprotease [Sulfurimonas sp.]|uniref:M48 family metalloprotease n=1 Tax=Sulfurimonas sp. TaxID=2022749 RepID=UPI0026321A20|nr:M48 family metalloprotease [Sulfurimonas sp.]MCW8896061.1 M48 family metalloprotease [Sulfurimonas sp.]
MKKIFLSSLIISSLFAFDLGIGSLISVVKSGASALGMDGETSTINVDRECNQAFESYDLNTEALLKTTSMYGISKSDNILDFLNTNKSSGKDITSDDFKELSKIMAKNFLWIPLEVEKIYGEKQYKHRIESGDVILKTTRNKKYKKMYAKIDKYLRKYNSYLEKNDLKYPYDIKIYILSTQKKAESLPYGYVFISEDYIENGMYETILSHELAHVSKRHATKEIQYQIVMSYDNITDIMKLIKEMQDENVATKVATGFMTKDIIKASYELYPQEQEIEADACGLKTINAFIPDRKEDHVKNFIANVNNSKYDDKEKEGGFQDHPSKQVRISNIKNVAQLF